MRTTEINNVTPEAVQAVIAEECAQISALLVSKNKAYGNSALAPMRVFSRGSIDEQLNVRIDDKISRIQSMDRGADPEDAELDLIGYLILKRVQRRIVQGELSLR